MSTHLRRLVAAALLTVFLAITLAPSGVAQELATPVPGGDESRELIELRAQVEEMRRSEDRLISVLNTAVFAVLAIAVTLIAFNVYQSRWSNERDRNTLRDELRKEFQTSVDLATAEIGARSESAVSDSLQGVYALIKTETDQKLAEVTYRVYKAEWDAVAAEFERDEADVQGGGLAVLFHSTLRLADLSIVLNNPYFFERTLDYLRRAVAAKAFIKESLIRELTQILGRFPSEYAVSRDAIVGQLPGLPRLHDPETKTDTNT